MIKISKCRIATGYHKFDNRILHFIHLLLDYLSKSKYNILVIIIIRVNGYMHVLIVGEHSTLVCVMNTTVVHDCTSFFMAI